MQDSFTEIAVAYLSNNEVAPEQLEDVLLRIRRAVDPTELNQLNPALVPPVPVDESVQEDHIVCLEDGKKVTLLRRHLTQVHNMTFEEYLEKWGLPADYPAVPPSYSKKRSGLAKQQGLGVRKD